MTHCAPLKKQNDDDEYEMAPPPDGGWGWVVVFASFMIHIIADGITYTFGILYVEYLTYFQESKSATAWIASILVGVTLGSGPISSAFTNKYGCRPVTIAGSFIASFGLGVSMFAPNVLTLYLTVGVMTGFGFGLIYLPAIVSVTCYFEKKRSFATGIAVCGSGIGTFVFAPLTEWLVQNYTWKGAMLILSGVCLNCVFFGALFRPLEPVRRKREIPMGSLKNLEETKSLLSEKANGKIVENGPSRSVKATSFHEDSRLGSSSPHLLEVPKPSDDVVFGSQGVLRKSNQTLSRSNAGSRQGSQQSLGVMYKKDILYTGSTASLSQHHKSNPKMYSGSVLRLSEEKEDPDSLSVIHDSKVCGCIPCSKEAKDAYKEMMDLSLLANGIFLLFTISNFCTSLGFNVPYVYIKDKALEADLDSDSSSNLLAWIGGANTVSRVILGYISDSPKINRLFLYNAALTTCGLATALSSFCVDYISFAVYSVVFGATAGAYVGLTSVILVDLLGLEKLTNAFGLLLMFQGIASLIGPPIGGMLYDAFGSYDQCFYAAGGMIAISGIILFAVPYVQRREKEAEANMA